MLGYVYVTLGMYTFKDCEGHHCYLSATSSAVSIMQDHEIAVPCQTTQCRRFDFIVLSRPFGNCLGLLGNLRTEREPLRLNHHSELLLLWGGNSSLSCTPTHRGRARKAATQPSSGMLWQSRHV